MTRQFVVDGPDKVYRVSLAGKRGKLLRFELFDVGGCMEAYRPGSDARLAYFNYRGTSDDAVEEFTALLNEHGADAALKLVDGKSLPLPELDPPEGDAGVAEYNRIKSGEAAEFNRRR